MNKERKDLQLEMVHNIQRLCNQSLNKISDSEDEAEIKNIEKTMSIIYKLIASLQKLSVLQEDAIAAIEANKEKADNGKMSYEDCHIIIELVKSWGLLKDDFSYQQIDEILLKANSKKGGIC